MSRLKKKPAPRGLMMEGVLAALVGKSPLGRRVLPCLGGQPDLFDGGHRNQLQPPLGTAHLLQYLYSADLFCRGLRSLAADAKRPALTMAPPICLYPSYGIQVFCMLAAYLWK